MPEGVALGDLPLSTTSTSSVESVESVDDGHVEVHTEDELRVLHELTGWALEHGYALAGLSVLRVSLEDIYLGLTQQSGADGGVTAPGPGQRAVRS